MRVRKMVSEGASVTAAMVATEFLEMGNNTLKKSATNDGMSIFIFTFYSNLLALCFLLPSTLFYNRKRAPPPISTSIFFRMLLLSCLRYIMNRVSILLINIVYVKVNIIVFVWI
jgi:hypothetical protein